jgi:hypothetical protein
MSEDRLIISEDRFMTKNRVRYQLLVPLEGGCSEADSQGSRSRFMRSARHLKPTLSIPNSSWGVLVLVQLDTATTSYSLAQRPNVACYCVGQSCSPCIFCTRKLFNPFLCFNTDPCERTTSSIRLWLSERHNHIRLRYVFTNSSLQGKRSDRACCIWKCYWSPGSG